MNAEPSQRLPITYVLPLRATSPLDDEATGYVRGLADIVDDVVVVDGSAPDVVLRHRVAFGEVARVLEPDPALACRNGKVQGVLTGLAAARRDAVVLADDDVRYARAELAAVLDGLASAEAVVPQNVFRPLPWHARWDTGRILVHRAIGGDMPGTIGVRAGFLRSLGGYDGDVLFENLELLRTVRAGGGRVRWAREVFVTRNPPTARHFAGQRVRQAYDELARPMRMAAWLALLPVLGWRVARGGNRALVEAGLGAIAVVGLAELGRRRAGGQRTFAPGAAWWAPAWLLERGVCSWLAVAARLRGGVRYAGGRIARAATRERALRRKLAARAASPTSDAPTEARAAPLEVDAVPLAGARR